MTGLTMAGALGIGPGAAMGATGAHRASVSRSTSPNPSVPSSRSGGWLVVHPKPPDSGTSPDATRQNGSPDATTHSDAAPGTANSGAGSANSGAGSALPASSGHGRRIVFDMSAQRVWLVVPGDRVERTYLVSGSRHHNLGPGSYDVDSKSRTALALNHEETMNYMVRFTQGRHAAIGFHDVPTRSDGTLVQSRSDLGTPLSAGCIRQWITDAKALWQFSDVGTKVVVIA